MNLDLYVETLRAQLVAAADAGGPESRATVEKLGPWLDAALRVVLLEALAAAADEITTELAPGTVEVRLRGRDPDFVVTLPAYEPGDATPADTAAASAPAPVVPVGSAGSAGDDEGATSRLNLRLPEGLKARIEDAARREGLSLNAWLVRAAAAAVDGTPPPAGRRTGKQHFTGWVR